MRVVSFRAIIVLAIGLATAWATSVYAQGTQRGGRGMMQGMMPGFGAMQMDSLRLLGIEKVQKEIGLTDEQKEKINKLREESRPRGGRGEGMEGMRDLTPEQRRERMEEMRKKFLEEAAKRTKEIETKLAEILKPEQLLRVKQIQLQQGGAAVLQREEVAAHLGLSDDQKAQLKTIAEEAAKEMRAGWESFRGQGQNVDREKIREQMKKAREESEKKSMAVLTDEQKKKFAEMMGEPFELDRADFRPQGGERPQGERRGRDRGGNRNAPKTPIS